MNKTKKTEQVKINEKVLSTINNVADYAKQWNKFYPKGDEWYSVRRLRHCSAEVYATDNGYFLKSYNTFIAYIPYDFSDCYDFLRYVYGYTATSVQHISKFAHDYGNGTILSWKEV